MKGTGDTAVGIYPSSVAGPDIRLGGEFLRFHFKHRFLILFSLFLQNIFLSTKFLDDLFCLFTLYMLCRVFLNFGACTVAIRLKGGGN